MCDEILVILEGTQAVYVTTTVEKWKRQLRDFFNSRSRCGRDAKILNIEIEYETIKKQYCADMSINECLKLMTPKQFFNEFGNFSIDKLYNK